MVQRVAGLTGLLQPASRKHSAAGVESRPATEDEFQEQWQQVPDTQEYENGFKLQWEDFIRHVVENKPWRFDLLEGAKGVQLAELGLKSWAERRWVEVPALSADATGESVSIRNLSINLATVRQQSRWPGGGCVPGKKHYGIAPWRDQVKAAGLAEAVEMVRSNKLRVTGLCRGGMFPATDKNGLAAAIDDNKRAIDEAVALHADCLVMVVGGLAKNSRDIGSAREMVADGLAAILPHARACRMPLAIEPLHPMYAADRACINTLEQALDVCDLLVTEWELLSMSTMSGGTQSCMRRSCAQGRAGAFSLTTSAIGWCRRAIFCWTAG